MKLGYLATGHFGTTYRLVDPDRSPRQQLLEHCHRKHCEKMYVDSLDTGRPVHKGYIVAGEWFTLYEVHSWNGRGL